MELERNTVAKTEIQNLLLKSPVALSQTEILIAINGLCNKVTIYRVLERLVESGKIHKIINFDGVLKYAKCKNCSIEHKHNHIHFSCNQCKSFTCLEDVEPTYKLPKNYKVSEMNFTLSGLCPQCS